MKQGNGVLVLVLGILSVVGFGCLTGLPAWLLGNNALEQIRMGRADPSEEGMIQAGRVLGIITTVLTVIGVGIWLLFVGGLLALGAAGSR